MNNIVIFGPTQSGKTTLMGYLCTGMLRHPQFNEEVFQKLKLIKSLTTTDDFKIGDPHAPVNINKDIILPSFVSLDRDELRKFRKPSVQATEGTTKRLHRKQLTICVSERDVVEESQDENENTSCTFVDVPGFRQRLSDKYRGFFEGDIGIAVLSLRELESLSTLLNATSSLETEKELAYYERRLFEPIRIWCDYRSPKRLVIVISQIDSILPHGTVTEEAIRLQCESITRAIECIGLYTDRFYKGVEIPIAPISIRLSSEPNNKKYSRMSVFFHRNEENVYRVPKGKTLPGTGTLISCLKKVIISNNATDKRMFSLATVNRIMKAIVDNSAKTAINIRALHGSIHSEDTIILGPIIEKKSGEIAYTKCDIASIKADGAKHPSDILLEGNIGGLIFKSIQDTKTVRKYHINSDHINSDIKILKSTILCTGDILKGDIVSVEIYKDDYINAYGNLDEIYDKILPSILPFDQLILFWFGKKISVNIVEIVPSADKICLSMIVSKSERNTVPHFALPCNDDGSIRHNDSVLLAIPELKYIPKTPAPKQMRTQQQNVNQMVYTYLSASIVALKNHSDFNSIEIKAKRCMELDAILSGIVHFDSNLGSSEITSYNIHVTNSKQTINLDSVLTAIHRRLQDYYNRTFYRQLGGVKLNLIKTDY